MYIFPEVQFYRNKTGLLKPFISGSPKNCLGLFNLYYTIVHLKNAFNERNLYSGLFTFHCDKINGIWAEIPAQDFTHDFIFNIHRYCFIEVSVTGTFLC